MANIVTTLGMTNLLKLWSGVAGGAALSHIGVGTGTTAPAIGDTALGAEVTRIPNTLEAVSGAQMTIEGFYTTEQGNGVLDEVGLFDAAAAGGLHFRGQPVAAVTKTTAKQMRATVVITAGNG